MKERKVTGERSKSSTRVYLVSLLDEKQTLFRIRNKLNDKINVFGIDGRDLKADEYFGKAIAGHDKPMTPGEAGCALSHIEVLKDFVNSNHQLAYVFEDDVDFCSHSLKDLRKIGQSITWSGPTVLILGGQQGLPGRNKICGTKIKSSDFSIWFIPAISRRWVWRTCGYVVNRSMAELILSHQKVKLSRIDYWSDYNGYSMYLTDAVSHPQDPSSSLIEKERQHLPTRFFLLSKLKGAAILVLLLLSGYQRVFRSK
jgi:glycosyl transferase family 25